MIPFKGRKINEQEPVEVYRNLHKACLSIRQRGKVVAHTDSGEYVKLIFPDMIVRKAGNERVRRENRKNVHAWIRGFITPFEGSVYQSPKRLTYNPYKHDTFVDKKTGEAVLWAKCAILNEKEAFYIEHPNISHLVKG